MSDQSDREAYLRTVIARLEAENSALQLANKQLKSQHDFAFASWKQSLKRQGVLSAELAHTHSQVAAIARAETTPLPHPSPMPNMAQGSRADVRPPPGSLAALESRLTVIRRRPPTIEKRVQTPPPVPVEALCMPRTRVQTHPQLRRRS